MEYILYLSHIFILVNSIIFEKITSLLLIYTSAMEYILMLLLSASNIMIILIVIIFKVIISVMSNQLSDYIQIMIIYPYSLIIIAILALDSYLSI
jgi:hypothetical protein